MTIVTHNINPPIPRRDFDWSATTVDYEPGAMCGYGVTEIDAIQDLLDQMKGKAA